MTAIVVVEREKRKSFSRQQRLLWHIKHSSRKENDMPNTEGEGEGAENKKEKLCRLADIGGGYRKENDISAESIQVSGFFS